MKLQHSAALITLGALASVILVKGQDTAKTDAAADDVMLIRASVSTRAGSAYADWCSIDSELLCRGTGTECATGERVKKFVESPSNVPRHTDFCVCKSDYEPYTSAIGERCRLVTPVSAGGECEISEDCSKFGTPNQVAVCQIPPAGGKGTCTCVSTYTFLTDKCIPFDCKTDSAKCKTIYGDSSICKESVTPAVCGCPDEMALVYDKVVGKEQCKALLAVKCDTSQCPSPFVCTTQKQCECPKGTVFAAASGQNECKVLTIGSSGCKVDTECPENAQCWKPKSDKLGICICKEYYKVIPSAKNAGYGKCQLALGTCCKTNADCGETKSGSIQLDCIRSSPSAQRGMCLCRGLGTNAWVNDKCTIASC